MAARVEESAAQAADRAQAAEGAEGRAGEAMERAVNQERAFEETRRRPWNPSATTRWNRPQRSGRCGSPAC